ncbi:acetyltransferase [Erwinia phage vB_EamM_Asesino]|uniref:Acetyltransferase n=1 Tax=Erwinia phage vB_EamM_Asesino TaxID=1883370 RepID=A0A1B2IA13_9CAUD|nr:acetyltransferase [Erwinia phage vB_EamM_Asesino]ANZ48117.1 putative acetyltransferase [Erwinia phage vB_EamM_Asesino]
MHQIDVSLDKISEKNFPGLTAYIADLNSIREEPVRVTMAVEDDIAHGVMVWEPGNLIYVVVSEPSRRQGVATFLLNYLKQNSERKQVACRVYPSNIAALGFFSARGFQIDRWYIANDSRRYFRMTNSYIVASYTPPEEGHLAEFVDNTPIFLSVANKVY